MAVNELRTRKIILKTKLKAARQEEKLKKSAWKPL